jgi:type 1 glutamine amidotransferase
MCFEFFLLWNLGKESKHKRDQLIRPATASASEVSSMAPKGESLLHRRKLPYFFVLIALVLIFDGWCLGAQATGVQATPPVPHAKEIHLKHVLVIAQTKGFEHDSVSDVTPAIWDTEMRTDTELLTKKDLGRNVKNLNYFDRLILASTTGELDLDASQKDDILSFVLEDGKGFLGLHAALDTNYTWPEYGEMIGGWFDQHPWMRFNAPMINEQPDFPEVRHFPKLFVNYDEVYQPKAWSRNKVNVLLSLDTTKLDYSNNPRIHRTDHDCAVAWSKMYGKRRVFYSTLGHMEESWKELDIRQMYFEAVKWALA